MALVALVKFEPWKESQGAGAGRALARPQSTLEGIFNVFGVYILLQTSEFLDNFGGYITWRKKVPLEVNFFVRSCIFIIQIQNNKESQNNDLNHKNCKKKKKKKTQQNYKIIIYIVYKATKY